MALRWQERVRGRWIGTDDTGEVGFVAHTVTAGGARTYWFAWCRDGTSDGRVVGEFATAEEAMAAVERRL